jgi:multidrug resistance efflux pump
MAIVPLDQVWVDANFKEPQLADMRGGQPVTLKADIYGRSVKYHGKVGRLWRRNRIGFCLAACSERDRQLDQDRARAKDA